MHSIRFKVENQRKRMPNAERFIIKKEWAEFVLRRRVINCLLMLFSLSSIFALVMVAFGKIRMGATSALIAATVGYIGKLLNNSFKSVFPRKG